MIELGTFKNIIGCVPGGDCRVQTLLVRRHDSFVSSTLAAFLDCARSYARNLNVAACRFL